MQLHLVSKEIWRLGMHLMNFMSLGQLDAVILLLCYLKFGNTSKYGIHRPKKGPFYLKKYSPVYPLVDVGTFDKIKSGEIQVCLFIIIQKKKFKFSLWHALIQHILVLHWRSPYAKMIGTTFSNMHKRQHCGICWWNGSTFWCHSFCNWLQEHH